jgi:hypothetical protein
MEAACEWPTLAWAEILGGPGQTTGDVSQNYAPTR